MKRQSGWTGLLALLLSLALLPPAFAQAGGQDNKSTASPATSVGSATGQPDVVILIFPLSNGQYTVSAVYSKEVPKRQTEDSIQQVLAAGGWQGERFAYENKAMDQSAKDFGFPSGGKMSSISGFVKGNIVGDDGTVSLGPFLMGFRDQNMVQITVATPQGFKYAGPLNYSDAKVEFQCTPKEGALICAAKIKDHKMEELTLPRFESTPTDPTARPEQTGQGAGNLWKIVAIVGASLAAGVAVFLLARRAVTR